MVSIAYYFKYFIREFYIGKFVVCLLYQQKVYVFISSSGPYSFRTLEIILDITLFTAALNNLMVIFENHVFKFLSHYILLLSGTLLPYTFLWKTDFKGYLTSFLIICPR